MLITLHASHNGELYRTYLGGLHDIAELVHESPHALESATTAAGAMTFWFRPRSRSLVNPRATELLLATTAFTARQVPLLHGDVVITGRDAHGNLHGLTSQQFEELLDYEPRGTHTWTLSRRFTRDRRQRRAAFDAAQMGAAQRWQ